MYRGLPRLVANLWIWYTGPWMRRVSSNVGQSSAEPMSSVLSNINQMYRGLLRLVANLGIWYTCRWIRPVSSNMGQRRAEPIGNSTSNLKLQYILLETRPQIWNPSTLYSEITIGNSTSNLKLQYIVLETRPQIWNPSPLILLEIPLLRLDGVKYQSNILGFVATGRKSMDMIHRSLNSSRVVKYGLNQSWASILS